MASLPGHCGAWLGTHAWQSPRHRLRVAGGLRTPPSYGGFSRTSTNPEPSQAEQGLCPARLCSPAVPWDGDPRGRHGLFAPRLFLLLFFFFSCCLAERPAWPPGVPGSSVLGCALWKSGCCHRSTCALTLWDRSQLWGTASAGGGGGGRQSPAAPRREVLHALAQEPYPRTASALGLCLCHGTAVPRAGRHLAAPARAVLAQLPGWAGTWLVVPDGGRWLRAAVLP